MKKTLVTIMMLGFGVINMIAGELSFLKGEQYLNVEIDYSEALIGGYEESNILEYEEDWENDKPTLYRKFIDEFSDILKTHIAGKISKANYTVIVKTLEIRNNGNMKAYFVISDTNERTVYRSETYSAKGGRFGSFLNLVGDGMESLGKRTASIIKNELK